MTSPKFLQFLYWCWHDFRHPIESRPFGIYCLVGLPGSGKTLSAVKMIEEQKQKFPNALVCTNFGYYKQDFALNHWEDLINIKNGSSGVIFVIDEVHDTFDRNDFKIMPKSILSLFSQNRKHAKMFICTDQAYNDIVIDIRRRTHAVIECVGLKTRSTVRWVFQKWYNPKAYVDGFLQPDSRVLRRDSFICDDDLFDSYDTYAVVQSLRGDNLRPS
jgi:hypothetical protein